MSDISAPNGAPAAPRLARTCEKCKVVDTHAHHVNYAVATRPDGSAADISVSKHIQCCAADGCAICRTDVEFVGAPIGDEFTAAMQAKSAGHREALLVRHGIETVGV